MRFEREIVKVKFSFSVGSEDGGDSREGTAMDGEVELGKEFVDETHTGVAVEAELFVEASVVSMTGRLAWGWWDTD